MLGAVLSIHPPLTRQALSCHIARLTQGETVLVTENLPYVVTVTIYLEPPA